MSDDTKDRGDPAHETMPPELRPFAKPEPPQHLVAPENQAKFDAAVDALRILNGGPKADPFYVDPRNEPERPAPESTKAYAPPVAVPAAEASVRRAAPARVVIAETGPQPRLAARAQFVCEEIDTRVFQEAVKARRAAEKSEAAGAPDSAGGETMPPELRPFAKPEPPHQQPDPSGAAKTPETPASPWTKEADPTSVRGSALPSSLRPRALAAESDVPARAPVRDRTRATAAIGIAIVVLAVALLGLRAFVNGRPPEGASPSPAPTTTAVPTAPTAPPPAPPASAEEHAPPAVTASSTVEAAPVPSGAAAPPVAAPRPKPHRALDDPYGDASAPSQAVTSGPTATPSATPPPAAPPAAPEPRPLQPEIKF